MHLTKTIFTSFLLGIVYIFPACSSSQELNPCNVDKAINLGSGTCLIFDDQEEINVHQKDIEKVITETITRVNKVMPIDNVSIRILSDPSKVIPEIGIGGFNPNSHEVLIWINPNFINLSRSINQELGPMIAHELHHANRRRAVGYGSTLLEASISEGLADCFSIEIFDTIPPLWSVAVTGNELETWIDNASETWENASYDHDKWFFGTNPDVPRWLGYSIGYKLVKDFILQNADKKPSDLFNEPATSFVM